jgi:N6-L-threonylcarbamoyladenine synthase
VDVLVTKLIRAAKRLDLRCVTASGGVTCNRKFRQELAARCASEKIRLRLAAAEFCTDNAGMIAMLAERKTLLRKAATDMDADICPSWPLSSTSR